MSDENQKLPDGLLDEETANTETPVTDSSQEIDPQETEAPSTPQTESTQIVSRQGDPSIFDTATVIKPSENAPSEVTRYFKEIKNQSNFDNLKLSSSLSPFPDKSERRNSRERRARSKPVSEDRRRDGRRDTDPRASFFSDLGYMIKEFGPTTALYLGMTIILVFLGVFAFTIYKDLLMGQIELSAQKPVPVKPPETVPSESPTIGQLKVEFLSDLHKNIEATKAHAPLY